MIKRLFVLILSFFALTLTVPLFTFAQDQTSSSEQYRLQQIENAQASLSAKKAVPKASSITFSEGTVISVSGSIILIETKDGTKTIYTADSTKYFNLDSAGKKLIGIGDLKSGDNIDVVGLSSQTNSGSAKIVVRDQIKVIKNFSLFGKVAEITATNLKVSNLTRADLPNIAATLNNETTFTNNRSASLKISDFLINDKVIIAGYFNDKNNLITKQLFKISPIVTKTATPSAK